MTEYILYYCYTILWHKQHNISIGISDIRHISDKKIIYDVTSKINSYRKLEAIIGKILCEKSTNPQKLQIIRTMEYILLFNSNPYINLTLQFLKYPYF